MAAVDEIQLIDRQSEGLFQENVDNDSARLYQIQ